MIDRTKPAAPSPEVQYLPAIFRRIQSGDIRMPAFQRGFVWGRKQVIELLESIYRGFPIGSVLLWKADRAELQIEDSSKSNFPQVREKFPVSYVLDGLQRLSALYAVFHFDPGAHDKKFDVAFDLESKEFVSGDDEDVSIALPLNVLFKPTEFIKYHAQLQGKERGSELIQNAVDLLSTFQEYLLPIVTIEGRSSSEVVQIFERINSTGVRLGAVDFMRAITWSEKFDLNRELARIAEITSSEGFEIPDETLMKVLAIALGYSPASDAMLGMRGLSAAELGRGVDKAVDILMRTVEFVRHALQLETYDLVPYEGQFLALAGFHKEPGGVSEAALAQMTRWFWTVSLNEDMQGRSEHAVARIVERMENFRAGKGKLTGRLTLTTSALKERRFRWGAALGCSLVAMFAKNGARSLITGELIDPDEFMSRRSEAQFLALAPEDQITAAIGKEVPAGKVVANIILAGKDEIGRHFSTKPTQIVRQLQRARPDDAKEILASQFISESASQALLKGRVADFLELRAQCILAFAQTLTFPPPKPA